MSDLDCLQQRSHDLGCLAKVKRAWAVSPEHTWAQILQDGVWHNDTLRAVAVAALALANAIPVKSENAEATVQQADLDTIRALVQKCSGGIGATGATNGCNAEAQCSCLPGLDAIGVVYDAVKGSSFGVGLPIVNFNYTQAANVWSDPFGNQTKYSYADQAHVMQDTTQSTTHPVYRSVEDYVTQQQADAHVDAQKGYFFKASIDTQWAKTQMSDSLHIVADGVRVRARRLHHHAEAPHVPRGGS